MKGRKALKQQEAIVITISSLIPEEPPSVNLIALKWPEWARLFHHCFVAAIDDCIVCLA